MIWSDVYKLPFKFQGGYTCQVYDAKGLFAFQFEWDGDEEFERLALKQINGKSSVRLLPDFEVKTNGEISYQNEPFISIRGWGHLTGVGGLRLSNEEAIEIQDSLARYIVKQLTFTDYEI